MNKNSFLKFTLLLSVFVAVFFVSCDDDFNEIGTDIVGLDNYNYIKEEFYPVVQNLNIGAVETTNLQINPLGVYENPVYGTTTASFVTQLELATLNPDIDRTKEPEMISVVLRVPYMSKADPANTAKYLLDSVYGPNPYSKMKLNIYESGYFLRDLDPLTQETQAYYSNQKAEFESALVNPSARLNKYTTDLQQNDEFVFSNSATETTTYEYNSVERALDSVKKAAAPAMKIYLDKEFFKQKILKAPADKLVNNNVFKDYIRGLYFKLERNVGQGNMAMLDFSKGIITINYKYTKYETVNDVERIKNIDPKTLILNLKGKTVSLIDQAPRIVAPDASKLFLKGSADNSMAVIDLLTANELGAKRRDSLLINEAVLSFTVDKAAMGNAAEPLRLYLYDFNNKKAILDYTLDYSTSTKSSKLAKRLYNGIIKRDTDGRGIRYSIRLTKHVIQLVKVDTTTNVRLGLVVTEDINVATNKKVRIPQGGGALKVIPTMSAAHPLGTILYGSNIPESDPNYDKRPKLEIYYTKPK